MSDFAHAGLSANVVEMDILHILAEKVIEETKPEDMKKALVHMFLLGQIHHD